MTVAMLDDALPVGWRWVADRRATPLGELESGVALAIVLLHPPAGRRNPLAGRTHVRRIGGVRVELESMRRSLAVGGTLTRRDIETLLDTCDRLAQQDEMVRRA
jgi:hypothetical protein